MSAFYEMFDSSRSTLDRNAEARDRRAAWRAYAVAEYVAHRGTLTWHEAMLIAKDAMTEEAVFWGEKP